MELVSEKLGDIVVVKIKGQMDTLTAPDFERKCFSWIDRGETDFAVDLGELEYISSFGIRSILIVAKKLKVGGGQVHFCCLSGMVKKVFSLAGFLSMFPIYDSLEQALGQY